MERKRTNVILFIATVITTFLAAFLPGYLSSSSVAESIIDGFSFSLTILFILGCHEMGHYLMGKKYGVNITLPYFIPAPPLLSPIGTFGAFIKIKSPITTRKALFDIGVAGPLAGIVPTIPVILIGLALSRVDYVKDLQGVIYYGSPPIFSFLSDIIFGEIPEGHDVLLHPVAFAGWIGLFVTALNLLPAGQLDGGHIMYALFPRSWHRKISALMVFVLLILGVGTKSIVEILNAVFEIGLSSEGSLVFEGWPGWIIWAVILSFLGTKHPPTMDDYVSLDAKRKFVGFITLLVFIGCFTPVPIRI